MPDVKIHEISLIEKKKRIVVTGFAGAGFIANTAVMHIANINNYKHVGYAHGNVMPPLMVLLDGEPKHSFRIYTDASDELMFLVTEANIIGRSTWEIGHELMSWLKGKGISEIISLEGFPFANPNNNLFGFTTTLKRNLLEYNIQPITQGAVSGLNAVMLDEVIHSDIPWTTIFVPTRLVSRIDYLGAIAAIQTLKKILRIEVDTEQLEKISAALTTASKNVQRQEKKGGFLDRILSGQE